MTTWFRNPFFHAKDDPPSDSSDAEAALPEPDNPLERPNSGAEQVLAPSEKLTGHQFFYIFILDGLGAMVLSGGVNFAIAYAMYTTQNTNAHPIRLFQLPNTLAGDAAVTIIVQCIITWLVELVLVNRDLRSGRVQPIGFLPEPSLPVLRWFLFLDRTGQASEPGGLAHWAFFLFSQVLRGFLISVASFCVVWGPCVGILTAVGERRGGDWYFEKKWAPQVFKLLLGGVLGVLTTPPIAGFWLVRCGWALKTNEAW
ncbi:hypothetical protein NKR23_g3201 [Pleurostoma richardsiae]|uniref:Uncharacterized protein n=1 Tax=Pleurostoma richardsiae TaxID=41990 RepID=A0AA38RZP6_9PEZI|nr:hypothetical protein NKR23_g3201 [Pleurostoma richardsiae]